MPDMKPLFESVGVSLTKDADKIWFGSFVRDGKISGYPTIGSPAYKAGLDKDDSIKSIGDFVLSDSLSFNDALKNFKPNDKTKIVFERFGEQKETEVTFMPDPSYSISVFEANGLVPTEAQKANRDVWLSSKN
jgi:predicted metalloprotease with PDZ domain